MLNILVKILQRILGGAGVLLFVSLLVFLGTEVLPGDLAQTILGQSATPEAVEAIRLRLGLDQPAAVRYLQWLGGFVTGDLGKTLAMGQDVGELILKGMTNTFLLAGATAMVAVPLSIILGLLAATRPESLLDRTISVGTLCMISLPDFLVGIVLVFIFSVQMGWLPALATYHGGADIIKAARALVLPVITLTFCVLAHMTRMTRTAVLNVLTSPAIEMAILKGVPKWRIMLVHALPNALAPIANVIALNLAWLISGIVVTETLFNFGGLGKLMVEAVSIRDIPLVQASAMVFCATYVVLNLLADGVAILSNPRIRYPK